MLQEHRLEKSFLKNNVKSLFDMRVKICDFLKKKKRNKNTITLFKNFVIS